MACKQYWNISKPHVPLSYQMVDVVGGRYWKQDRQRKEMLINV